MIVKSQITRRQVEELIKYSNTDEEVKSLTSDAKRFKDKKSYKSWLKKGRKIYVMTNSKEELLGIIWYGKEQIPGDRDYLVSLEPNKYGITFAIRIYGSARGKGLAHRFMTGAWNKYRKTSDFKQNPSDGVWLETNKDNTRAVSTYLRFGFEQVSVSDENGRIIMIFRKD